MTTQQLAILNALVTFAAENVPGGLSLDEREVAKIVGGWALNPPVALMQEWPRYRMLVDGEVVWLPLKQAGIVYDNGWVPVSIGGQAMEENGRVRDIQSAEWTKISDIADDWSASK